MKKWILALMIVVCLAVGCEEKRGGRFVKTVLERVSYRTDAGDSIEIGDVVLVTESWNNYRYGEVIDIGQKSLAVSSSTYNKTVCLVGECKFTLIKKGD